MTKASCEPFLSVFYLSVVLEPQQRVGALSSSMPLKQHKNSAQQFTKRKMIRNDNPTMLWTTRCGLTCKSDEISHVERQYRSALTRGKRELLGI